MKYLNYLATPLLLFTFFFLVFPQRAYAYLDPGTGSYFLQLVLAFFVGALFTVKIYWKKINTFFANLFSKQPKDEKDGD